jgi:hypothetical protein
MFSLHDQPSRLCDGINRRELIRIGGLSALGLSLPGLLQAGETRQVASTFGRARSVLFLWLQGGPPQHETFDPKPEAPAEVRGEFKPIATNVPGIHISELLPRTATIADKLAIVRSMHTNSDLHDASGYWVLTGTRYTGRESRQISPSDWPYLGSIVKMLKPSEKLPAMSSVWLPDVMRLNDNVTPAGQTAGFLGKRWEPHRIIGDPSLPGYEVEGLALPPEIPPLRLSARADLREQVESHFRNVERGSTLKNYDQEFQEAYRLLSSGRAREAFDIDKEPVRLRERYGLNKWGQCLLLGRRLIEAGVRLVHVNWPREGGDEVVTNPMWDTHAQNADRLQDVLCPMFDVGFSALMEDLEQRGLLAETLVVVIGEFGRTPRINGHGGRDHWGHVFSFALAGAGISGSQVYGSSDKLGGYPRDGAMEPQDLTATILHLLGIDPLATFLDPLGRPYPVTRGEPIAVLLGDSPATSNRVTPTGNIALVPEYSKELVLNPRFNDDLPLIPAGAGKRLRGWQAHPIARVEKPPLLGVAILKEADGTGRHAAIGFGLDKPSPGGVLTQSTRAFLTQEIRNPRAGYYTITARVGGGGVADTFGRFREAFTFRLVLFGYADLSKNPTQPMRELASLVLEPVYCEHSASDAAVTLTRKLRSQEAGATEIEMGVGLALIVEKTTPGEWKLAEGSRAYLRISQVDVAFSPASRNDDVTV